MIFGTKNEKKSKIFENFFEKFFFGIDSESFKTHFKMKSSKIFFWPTLTFTRLGLRNLSKNAFFSKKIHKNELVQGTEVVNSLK